MFDETRDTIVGVDSRDLVLPMGSSAFVRTGTAAEDRGRTGWRGKRHRRGWGRSRRRGRGRRRWMRCGRWDGGRSRRGGRRCRWGRRRRSGGIIIEWKSIIINGEGKPVKTKGSIIVAKLGSPRKGFECKSDAEGGDIGVAEATEFRSGIVQTENSSVVDRGDEGTTKGLEGAPGGPKGGTSVPDFGRAEATGFESRNIDALHMMVLSEFEAKGRMITSDLNGEFLFMEERVR